MSDTSTPDLGRVVTNAFARKIIYGTYVLALTATGATQVWYATIGNQPDWLLGVVAVIGYLGVPVGGLALANTPSKPEDPPAVG
jgi:hypothetical protein